MTIIIVYSYCYVDSPIVLTKTNRETALLGDNVTLEFAISAYPNIEESSIHLQFQQLTNTTCGVGIQIGGGSLIVTCTRNSSRVFVTITGVTLEIAGRYTLTAGNKVGIGTDFTDLAVQNINSSICGDFCDIARVNKYSKTLLTHFDTQLYIETTLLDITDK